ncbi:NRAMP (natural resistance-associated macrophage protein)-like metal ion transporter [Blastomonas natatoria]|uniref:NRAMP (Natural resistance-associated macrophage protein)-like metal ion transporter n=2 Tax=Blastomonas natatoria TaxID=34015 RepID=A0A2V3VBP5_9SPHN|nr:NRAMP (natural resistance-associated macrophage protein)-like metal ion transporter [Blastomonas natatoria]
MLVTAAFIGPGTVTACASAGIGFGYALLWALVFATLATAILQAMAARVALVTGQGLAEAILSAAGNPALRWVMAALIFASLAIGNSAYQAGNISGTAAGLKLLGLHAAHPALLALATGTLAAMMILIGKPAWLEKLLIALVLAMSLAFVGGLAVIEVDWLRVAGGLLPQLPADSLFTAIALIGTTVVPYNLFLHAASVRGKFAADAEGLAASRLDTALSVTLGGLLSMAIVIMGAATAKLTASGAGPLDDIALRLETLFGGAARSVFALGLIGAGFSSALTAPLATGYVLAEMIGGTGDPDRRARIFKGTALAVVTIGTVFAVLSVNPVQLILIAQSANGLLLPILAAFLLWVAARKASLGEFANGPIANIAGTAVVLVCAGLGARLILRSAGLWP